MSYRNCVAYVCIAIPSLAELGLGVVYVTASKVMPYHQEALGADWTEFAPGIRALLITLVNGYGSAHFSVGVALSILLFVPLRQGHAWARWAILAVGFPVLGGTAFLSARLAERTGADIPWQGATILLLLFLVGVALADPRLPAATSMLGGVNGRQRDR